MSPRIGRWCWPPKTRSLRDRTGRWKRSASPVTRYTGGQRREVSITLGVDLADWYTSQTNRPFVMAWTGENPKSRRAGQKIHLFKSTWQNPFPEVEVRTVAFEAIRPGPAPFLVALTSE